MSAEPILNRYLSKDELLRALFQLTDLNILPEEVLELMLLYTGQIFHIGDMIDCQDPFGKWYLAEVIRVDLTRVKVSYPTWGTRWDEWIDTDSGKISRIYSQNEYHQLKSLKVGDIVDWFSSRFHVVECRLMEFSDGGLVKLTPLVRCYTCPVFHNKEFWEKLDSKKIKKVPQSMFQLICPRKVNWC
jgi:hypothetical protein